MNQLRRLFLSGFFLLVFIQAFQAQVPPPATGPNGCTNSPLLCTIALLDEYQGQTLVSPPSNPCPFSQAPDCPNSSCENNQWFSFIADTTYMEIEISPSMCEGGTTGNSLQGVIWEVTDCTTLSGFTPVSNCFSNAAQQDFTLVATNLVVGNIYVIMLDGFAGSLCDYEVNVLVGGSGTPEPTLTGPISGPTEVCPGATDLIYCIDVGTGVSDYDWSWLGGGVGTITDLGLNTDGTQYCVSLDVTTAGVGIIQVIGSNDCYEAAPVVTDPIVSTAIVNPPESETICLGESFAWECYPQISNPGLYTCDYTSWLGCDSSVSIIVGIHPVTPPDFQIITICEVDCPYNWNGTDYCSSGTYNYTYNDVNGCEVTDGLFLTVIPAEAVILDPIPIGCGADTIITLDGSLSTTVPELGGIITYSWTGPGILTSPDSITIDVDAPGDYTLTVSQTRDGVVCTDDMTVTVIEDAAPPNQPNVSGPIEICGIGLTGIYSVIPAATGAPEDGFSWTVTGGQYTSNTTGDTITVTWETLGLGQVCVGAYNECDTSFLDCLDVLVNEAPVIDTLIGPDVVCSSDTALIYTLSPTSDLFSYDWTVSGGASFSDLGDTIVVDYTGASNVQICVTAENTCGPSNQLCKDITINTTPVLSGINGLDTYCLDENGIFDVVAGTDVDSIFWTVPSNATIVSGQGTTNLEVSWDTAGVNQLCVDFFNECGNTQECITTTVFNLPTADISGSLFKCVESTDTLLLDLVLTGQAPWTVTVALDGTDLYTTTINNSPATLPVVDAGSYTVSQIVGANGCSNVGTGSGELINNDIPTATLSGLGSICENSGDCVDLTVVFTGTAPYTIQYDIDNVTQAPVTGINTDTFTLQICTPGTISLLTQQDGNGCQGTVGGVVVIEENTIPVVSNIDTSCDPNDDTEYFVSFEINAGDPSTYTVLPAGSGTITGNVFTSNAIVSATPYAFQVFDGNACDTVDLSGIFVCNCGNDVGEMDQALLNICDPDCATAVYDDTNEQLNADDLRQFVLHEGSGLSLQNIIATNITPDFCFDAGAGMVLGQTYYISAITGDDDGTGNVDLNDLCLAVAQGTPVRFFEIPAVTIGAGTAICIGESFDITLDFTAGASPWSIVYDAGSGPDTLSGIQNANYLFNVAPTATTSYCFTEVFNATCSELLNTCVDVIVNEPPTVNNVSTSCNDTGDAFEVSFEISGGDAGSYEVLPAGSGTLTGNVFVSNLIPENSTYSFQVTDANACDTILVETSNPVECACLSMAGTISDTSYEICGADLITVTYDPTGSFLDGNDVVNFMLFEGNLNDLANVNVIDLNDTGIFGFDAASMNYGQTYSVAVGVGNGVGGIIQFSDECLVWSNVVPAVFYEIPTANLTANDTICLGDVSTLSIQFTGDAPFAVEITEDIGGVLNTVLLEDIATTNYSYDVSPSATATYTIANLNDEFCPGLSSGTVEVVVNEAPVVTGVTETINLNNTDVVVSFTISGGEAPYTITDADGNTFTSVDGSFDSAEIPCGNGYYFEVDDGNACGPVIVNAASTSCPCLTNAGDIVEAGPIEVCNDVVSLTYDATNEFLDGNDTISFLIHNGNYAPVAPNNNEPTFNFGGAMVYGQTYFVSVVAGDMGVNGGVSASGACLDTNSLAQVIFYEEPSAALSGGGIICEGESIDLDVEFLNGIGPWTVEVQNNQSGLINTFTLNNPQDVVTVTPAITSNYTIISVTDAIGLCSGNVSGNVLVQVQQSPTSSNIQGTTDYDNETYNVSFNISGGDQGTYVVTLDPNTGVPAGTINGNVFTADPIPCTDQGQTYTFYLYDGFGCEIEEIDVVVDCECFTSLGSFDTGAAQFCFDQDISVDAMIGANLDGNDVVNYVVVSVPANWQNTILDVNSTPDFVNDPSVYTCGTTYFILAVAGDDLGNGFVDPTDQCLVVSAPKPFQILCPIQADFGSDVYEVCIGNTVSISFDFDGAGPFNVIYNDGTSDQTLNGLIDGELVELNLTDTTTLTLISVIDVGSGCSATFSESAVVNVNNIPFAGTANSSPALCFGLNEIYDLNDLLDGEDAGGTWSETSTNPSTGGAFNATFGTFATSGQNPGVYTFQYFIEGEGLCPDDSESIILEIYPVPEADAGLDGEVTCEELTTEIGGPNSTSGSNIVYTWTDPNNTVISDQSTVTIGSGGVFTLTVENTLTGCVDTDEVNIIDKIDILFPEVFAEDISCFEFADGFLAFEEIIGGEGPYLYSIDGGQSYSDQLQYSNLDAGTYDIQVLDVNGCSNDPLTIELTEPALLTLDIDAAFTNDDSTINYGDTILVELIANAPITDIQWTPSEIVSCDTCSIVAIGPLNSTVLTATIQAGECSTTEALTILVRKDEPVFVPTAFSPNGDNVNDVLNIYIGDFVKEVKTFQIFDRWGELMHSRNNFRPTNQSFDENGWNGTLDGKYCNTGVYVYYIEVEFQDGNIKMYKGDVTILR